MPVINENDTVVTDEIKFGDNDTLGALVANLVEADALVILTDQHGLFTADPRKDPSATLVEQADAGDARTRSAWPAARARAIGRGGMLTKILAAKRAARSGASTVIACGREPDVLLRLASGETIGTLLIARTARRSRRASTGWPIICRCAASRDRRRRGRKAARRRQEPAADRRDRRGGRVCAAAT